MIQIKWKLWQNIWRVRSHLIFSECKQIKFYFSNGDFYHWKNGFINFHWWIKDYFIIFNLCYDNHQFYFSEECDSIRVGAHDNVLAIPKTLLILWKESCELKPHVDIWQQSGMTSRWLKLLLNCLICFGICRHSHYLQFSSV